MLEERNIETFVDHIFSNSSIKHFVEIEKINNPHFSIFDTNGNQYYSMDNYNIEASMRVNQLMSFKHTYQLDINEAFLSALINEANFHLDDMFIRYIDSKASCEHISFEDKSYFKNIIRLFEYNTRFSFTNKKIDHKKSKNLTALLENLYREIYQYSEDSNFYLIVSKPIAEFIAHYTEDFYLSDNFKMTLPKSVEYKKHTTIPFGIISGKRVHTFNIFMNENIKSNTIYIGSIKRYGLGPKLYYYAIPNSIIEYSTLDYIDSEKHYRLNMAYKLIVNKNNIFKKIILDI